MGKDTIIPVKFEKELTNEEIEAFIDVVSEFAEAAKMEMTIISMSAIAKRVEARKPTSELNTKALPLHGVVFNGACKCDRPDPYKQMPYKCFRCHGKIEVSEVELICSCGTLKAKTNNGYECCNAKCNK